MKKTFVQIDGVLYEKGTEPMPDAPMIMGDIEPYKSMVTGEIITSRSRHREHLKQHGCVELGNDSSLWRGKQPLPDVAPQQRKEIIRAQVDAMSHAEFKAAIKRDVDRVKWNSRED
jgi:hypothetical protein